MKYRFAACLLLVWGSGVLAQSQPEFRPQHMTPSVADDPMPTLSSSDDYPPPPGPFREELMSGSEQAAQAYEPSGLPGGEFWAPRNPSVVERMPAAPGRSYGGRDSGYRQPVQGGGYSPADGYAGMAYAPSYPSTTPNRMPRFDFNGPGFPSGWSNPWNAWTGGGGSPWNAMPYGGSSGYGYDMPQGGGRNYWGNEGAYSGDNFWAPDPGYNGYSGRGYGNAPGGWRY